MSTAAAYRGEAAARRGFRYSLAGSTDEPLSAHTVAPQTEPLPASAQTYPTPRMSEPLETVSEAQVADAAEKLAAAEAVNPPPAMILLGRLLDLPISSRRRYYYAQRWSWIRDPGPVRRRPG